MASQKTVLYVGGLEETVNEATLHAAFIPFGEIKDVSIPLEHSAATEDGTAKHRGFGFVEFVERYACHDLRSTIEVTYIHTYIHTWRVMMKP